MRVRLRGTSRIDPARCGIARTANRVMRWELVRDFHDGLRKGERDVLGDATGNESRVLGMTVDHSGMRVASYVQEKSRSLSEFYELSQASSPLYRITSACLR